MLWVCREVPLNAVYTIPFSPMQSVSSIHQGDYIFLAPCLICHVCMCCIEEAGSASLRSSTPPKSNLFPWLSITAQIECESVLTELSLSITQRIYSAYQTVYLRGTFLLSGQAGVCV